MSCVVATSVLSPAPSLEPSSEQELNEYFLNAWRKEEQLLLNKALPGQPTSPSHWFRTDGRRFGLCVCGFTREVSGISREPPKNLGGNISPSSQMGRLRQREEEDLSHEGSQAAQNGVHALEWLIPTI